MLRLIRAGALALAALLLADRADAQPAPAFQVGPWQGQPRFDPQRRFVRCTIHSDQPNSVRLSFGMGRGRELEIWLEQAAWTLEPGAVHPVEYWIDGGAETVASAQVVANAVVRIVVADGTGVFEALKRGSRLNVRSASDTMTFRLDGSAKALDRLRQCTEEQIRIADAATAANPFAAPPPAQPMPSDVTGFAQWSMTMSHVATGLIALLDRLQATDRASESILTSTDEAARATFAEGQQALAGVRRDFTRLSAQADRLQPYQATGPGWRTRSQNLIRHTQSLRDQMAAMIDTSEQLLLASARREADVRRRLIAKAIDQSVTLLRSEIVTIELNTIDEPHPQHALQMSMLHGNEALIAALAYIRELLGGGVVPDAARKGVGQRAVADMVRQVSLGRQKTEAAVTALRGDRTMPPAQLAKLEAAIATYRESFDVEERLAAALEVIVDSAFAITPDRIASAESVAALMDRLAAAMKELVDRRMALIGERTQAIAALR